MVQNHIIKNFCFEYPSTVNQYDYQLQNKIGRLIREQLVLALEKELSKLVAPDEYLYLEKLELEFKLPAFEQIDELPTLLASTIVQELKNKLSKSKDDAQTKEQQIAYYPKSKSLAVQFLFFLKFGVFPWWSTTKNLKALEQKMLHKDVFDQLPVNSGLKLNLFEKETIQTRLIVQFSKEFLVRIVQTNLQILDAFSKKNKKRLFLKLLGLSASDFNNSSAVTSNKTLKELLLVYIVNPSAQIEQKISFLKNISNKITHLPNSIQIILQKELGNPLLTFIQQSTTKNKANWPPHKIITSGIPEQLLQYFKKTTTQTNTVNKQSDPKQLQKNNKQETDQQTIKNNNKQNQEDKDPFTKKSTSTTNPENNTNPTNKQHTKDHTPHQKTLKQLSENGIFINNAGIVLFAPFLKRLFKKLNYLQDNSFKDKTAQQKAIFLLQYIATGTNNFEEQELLLNKIICDYPVEETVDSIIHLTSEEMTEADALIQFVLKEWKALKNTSPASLRAMFLQREGKLSYQKGNGWTLQVDQKTEDILLQQLPWDVSLLKLPWSEDFLFVEWS